MENLLGLLKEFAMENGEFKVFWKDGQWLAIVKIYDERRVTKIAPTPEEALREALKGALGA